VVDHLVERAAGEPKRRKMISRKNAYHGTTVMTSSLTGKELIHPRFLELILSCLRNGRGAAASTLYTQLRRDHGFEVIRHRTSRVFAMPARRLGALRAMEALERMHARP
jgi:adenosylmethionine-8-amino-7-oxononanoate aminotransferase